MSLDATVAFDQVGSSAEKEFFRDLQETTERFSFHTRMFPID
jgi:hypothetical protein